jgi:hypothetical protein
MIEEAPPAASDAPPPADVKAHDVEPVVEESADNRVLVR